MECVKSLDGHSLVWIAIKIPENGIVKEGDRDDTEPNDRCVILYYTITRNIFYLIVHQNPLRLLNSSTAPLPYHPPLHHRARLTTEVQPGELPSTSQLQHGAVWAGGTAAYSPTNTISTD